MLPSVGAAESPGDFLLGFHHPQITFGKVVIERDVKVIEKGKDLLWVIAKAQEQVLCLSPFGSAPFALAVAAD